MTANILNAETSPYLLQHKDNPVHWQPWGPQSFELARTLKRPILLSVGYAACHWCHVMAHESFEDPATAARMNELFVNIKVDREERPDIDSIYQAALALLGEQGGWPLTMFLTPAGEPFWGGTYFPVEARYGRSAFRDVLTGISDLYQRNPDKIEHNRSALIEALGRLSKTEPGGPIGRAEGDAAAARILSAVDVTDGGIAGAPKFPHGPAFELLWRTARRSGDIAYRQAVLTTLTAMSQGGIYDHLGGGFARYSTDEIWLAPHFEKMLYDNAALIDLLTLVWQDTRTPLFEARVRETVAWLQREMIAPGPPEAGMAGFSATIDADSEGEEGRFYVWSEAEIDALLGDHAAVFKAAYDVHPGGNWEGKTILNRRHAPNFGDANQEKRLAACRAILLAARDQRPRPGLDDKVLADWNGLMIAALARAGAAFDEPDWIATAANAFAFVRTHMSIAEEPLPGQSLPDPLFPGRLFHSWRAGRARHAGMLDDYANMASAALALFEIEGSVDYLHAARGWVEVLDRHFRDADGAYFMTADDAEGLIVRTKTVFDGAVPAGNGTLADVLARLWLITGETHFRDRAEGLIVAFSSQIKRNYFGLCTLINAADTLQDGLQIVLVGEAHEAATKALLRVVHTTSLPGRVVIRVTPGTKLPAGHPAHGKLALDDHPAVYICRGQTCSLPINSADGLRAALGHA